MTKLPCNDCVTSTGNGQLIFPCEDYSDENSEGLTPCYTPVSCSGYRCFYCVFLTIVGGKGYFVTNEIPGQDPLGGEVACIQDFTVRGNIIVEADVYALNPDSPYLCCCDKPKINGQDPPVELCDGAEVDITLECGDGKILEPCAYYCRIPQAYQFSIQDKKLNINSINMKTLQVLKDGKRRSLNLTSDTSQPVILPNIGNFIKNYQSNYKWAVDYIVSNPEKEKDLIDYYENHFSRIIKQYPCSAELYPERMFEHVMYNQPLCVFDYENLALQPILNGEIFPGCFASNDVILPPLSEELYEYIINANKRQLNLLPKEIFNFIPRDILEMIDAKNIGCLPENISSSLILF